MPTVTVGTLSGFETALVAIILGIVFALVVMYQILLQKKAIKAGGGPGGNTVFERITFAGLGLAILFFSIVLSKHLTALGDHNFIFVFFASAAAIWLGAYIRLQVKRRR